MQVSFSVLTTNKTLTDIISNSLSKSQGNPENYKVIINKRSTKNIIEQLQSALNPKKNRDKVSLKEKYPNFIFTKISDDKAKEIVNAYCISSGYAGCTFEAKK